MSLVIGKLDREHGKHIIYSDGLCIAGTDIVSQYSKKVYEFVFGELKILFGGTGSHYINRYFSQHFKDTFEDKFIGFNAYNELLLEERGYYFEEVLPELFNQMRSDFAAQYSISETNEELSHPGSALVIINDMFFHIQCWEGEKYRCMYLPNVEFECVGIGDVEARCMLENNIPIEEVYKTIAKYKHGVNDNIFEEHHYVNMC